MFLGSWKIDVLYTNSGVKFHFRWYFSLDSLKYHLRGINYQNTLTFHNWRKFGVVALGCGKFGSRWWMVNYCRWRSDLHHVAHSCEIDQLLWFVNLLLFSRNPVSKHFHIVFSGAGVSFLNSFQNLRAFRYCLPWWLQIFPGQSVTWYFLEVFSYIYQFDESFRIPIKWKYDLRTDFCSIAEWKSSILSCYLCPVFYHARRSKEFERLVTTLSDIGTFTVTTVSKAS